MAPQIGAHFLERAHGGRGVLLGGAPGVRPARVVVLGAGNVGWNAAWIAQGMEAEVLLLDKNLDRLRWVDQIHKGRIMTLASNRGAVDAGGAPTPISSSARCSCPAGARRCSSPTTWSPTMKPGAVIVDCAIDQGGCIENIRETTHSGSGLRGARRVALRGRQRARRGAEHVDVRAHERDVAVRARARDPRRRRKPPTPTPRSRSASTPCNGQRRERGGGRGAGNGSRSALAD